MHNYLIKVFKGYQKIYSYTIILFILIMQAIVKVRAVNRSKFVAIPKDFVKKIESDYMTVKLDEMGRLIYTPVSGVS